ncbi:MAG TPA: SDR family oxidoreductase [Gemmatimonadaceae bacterium]|nr:SDR family oxidoreductase [Gemmatimonadaceae bacterium]
MRDSSDGNRGMRETGAVLMLGATSTIARALARELAAGGRSLLLAGRDAGDLDAIARDLTIRYGVAASVHQIDVLDLGSHARIIGACMSAARVEGAVIAFGELGDQALAQQDREELRRILETNFTGCASVLELVAAHFETRGGGWICALTSVAGDRGRQSNYVYGAAKAGLTAYLQGLRNRLSRAGVRVLTVKLGIVDTQMTFGMALPTAAEPGKVARAIVKAIDSRRDVVYVPWIWRWIMLAIRAIPERFFKRMRL